jgi:hypothetical protein
MDLIYSPWIWFFVVCIILFIVFIVVVELHSDKSDMHNWIWILFLFIIIFFAISIFLYLYFRSPVTVALPLIPPVISYTAPCAIPYTPIVPCNVPCNAPAPITPITTQCDIFNQPSFPMHYLNPNYKN